MTVNFHPSWVGALGFWLGSDDYSLKRAFLRDSLQVDSDQVKQVYCVRLPFWMGGGVRYAIEYRSVLGRECLVSAPEKPGFVLVSPIKEMSLFDFLAVVLRHFKDEPSALFFPLIIPLAMIIMMLLFGVWRELVLSNREVLVFFTKPGCDYDCVRRVLGFHSLVGLLFLIQLLFLFLPVLALVFQAPRYRSAVTYRVIQSHSALTAVLGAFLFVQLIALFPFRQYSKAVQMGIDAKVERLIVGSQKGRTGHHEGSKPEAH
jgi:hypothetical protein